MDHDLTLPIKMVKNEQFVLNVIDLGEHLQILDLLTKEYWQLLTVIAFESFVNCEPQCEESRKKNSSA